MIVPAWNFERLAHGQAPVCPHYLEDFGHRSLLLESKEARDRLYCSCLSEPGRLMEFCIKRFVSQDQMNFEKAESTFYI